MDKPIIFRSNVDNNVRCSLSDTSSCAVLQASSEFYAEYGLIHVLSGVRDVWIDHIIIDGNRNNRLNSISAKECSEGFNNKNSGRNAVIDFGFNISLTNSIIANALCASGFVWISDGSLIADNEFIGNGDHFTFNMWSDGLTCLKCDNAIIRGNTFSDNTDVDLILGSGVNSLVSLNEFYHRATTDRPAFAALMLDNFAGKHSIVLVYQCTSHLYLPCYITCLFNAKIKRVVVS